MKKFLLLLIAGSLLGSSYFTISFGAFQLSIYRICVFLLPILIIYIKNKDGKRNESIQNTSNYSYKFMIFWIVYSMISLIWVKDYTNWFKAFTFLISGTLSIYFIGFTMNTQKDFFDSFRIIQLMVFFHSLIGYYEVFTGNYKFVNNTTLIYNSKIDNISAKMPIGVFGNPNDYALFCLMGFFICFICFRISKNYFSRFISIIMAISCVVLLVLTQSRANYIGLLISLSVYWILSINKSTILKKFFIVYFIIFSILLIGVLIPNLYNSILTEVASISNNSQNIQSDLIRINLIKNGMIFLMSSYLMGVGIGNIEYYMTNFQVYYVGFAIDIHNWWFEILVTSGVIVFIGYIIMYIKNMRFLYKIYYFSKDEKNKFIAKVFYSFLAGFIVASTSSSSNFNKEWLWVLWGIIYAFVNFAYSNLSQKNIVI